MRYIDADWIYQMVENRYRVSSGIEHRCERDLLDLICQAPTADVVPKSEVDNLKVLLEMKEVSLRSLEELYDTDTTALIEAREKTEFEVAREIFEEIERLLLKHSDYEILCDGKSLWYYEESLGEDIAELKNKYQEGEPNGN